METYTPDHVETKEVKASPIKATFSMTKVLLWMGLGLLVTAIVSLSLPDLLLAITGGDAGSLSVAYIVLYVIGAIAILPCAIIIGMKAMTNKKVGITIAYFVYAIAIGIILSTIFMQVLAINSAQAFSIISISFFITAGCFLLMGGIGALTKKSLSGLIPFISTFLIGALILSLVNIFLQSEPLYWIIDFVILAFILICTAVDMNQVRKLVESKQFEDSYSMTIYSAFTLYVDFINIFIRIIYYVLLLFGRRDS